MIKVCHLTSAHPWDDIRIFRKECVSLAKNGFETTLVAFDAPNEVIDGVNVVSAGKKPQNRNDRFINGGKRILRKTFEIDADIYHFHDPELIPIAKKLAKRGKKIIYDIHEDVPRQILDKPYLNRKIASVISFFYEKYENYSIRNFAGLICATPFIRDRFTKLHDNVIDVNNFPVLAEITDEESCNLSKQDKICYIGSISEIRGIKNLVDSLKYCNGTRLDLAGEFHEGSFKEKVKLSEGWEFVNELGYINRKESMDIKKEAFAGLITFLPVANHINAQPNKLFEYMSAGLPLICSNFSLWKILIEQENCGICVNPNDVSEISNAINFIKENQSIAKQMGENGKNAVINKFNWLIEEQKLIEFYKKLSKFTS